MEYVGEDPTALPRYPWNRGRRRAALRKREREEIDNDEMTTMVVAGG
jgi:hypothetical protein